MTATPVRILKSPPRRRRLLGTYARLMLGHYLWHILIATIAITGVVAVIEIPGQADQLRAGAASAGDDATMRLARLIFYRTLDDLSQVFPVAFVLAICWAELSHFQSGRQMLVRTAGMNFQRGATALFIVAVLAIPVQFALDNFVRPYAFMSLCEQRLGEFGRKCARDRAEQTVFLPSRSDIVQVRLRDDPAPRMSDLTLYQFSDEGDLRRIIDAPTVGLAPTPDGRWTVDRARVWDFVRPSQAGGSGLGRAAAYSEHASLDVSMGISPKWLAFRQIEPKYIPLSDLVQLAGDPGVPDNAPNYRSWLQVRIAQAFAPGLIGICISAIFILVLDRFGWLVATSTMIAAAYLGFTLMRVMAVVAEHDVIPPFLAIWTLPVLFAASAASLIAVMIRRERRYTPAV